MVSIFGVAVFVCFSWTVLGFFHQLSSYILYFNIAEIAEIFAFMMALALLESLAIAGGLVLLAVILPAKWLKEAFGFKAFVLLGVFTAAAFVFQWRMPDEFPSALFLAVSLIAPIAVCVGLLFFFRSTPRLQKMLVNIQDRLQIMAFIYVPIGLLSLIVVLYRNFF